MIQHHLHALWLLFFGKKINLTEERFQRQKALPPKNEKLSSTVSTKLLKLGWM